MERVWLKSYPEGVPATIDMDAHRSLADYIAECVGKFADKTAFTNMGCGLTYREVDNAAIKMAAYLQSQGVEKGDRVAIMMPNCLQYPIALMAILRIGAVVVNVNPLYTARELKHILLDSEAKAIVVIANFAATVQTAMSGTPLSKVIISELGDCFPFAKRHAINFAVKRIKKMVPSYDLPNAITFNDALAQGEQQQLSTPQLSHADIAFLQYTGGTTGDAKGAVLTHGNMLANLMQASAWIEPVIKAGLPGGIVTALPLYHIFSLTANCFTFLSVGVPNILITNPRDIKGFVKELKRQPFSVLTGVNTLFNALLHDADFQALDFSNFRFTLGGGMAVQRAVAEKWKKVTGIPLIEAYGLTETSPAVTINPMSLQNFNGSIGLPVPSTDVAIKDEDGNHLAFGEPGELCVKGPQVMQGYWNRPSETAKVFDDEGWLHTGDIATVDEEGFVRIVDRKKDMILVSGFNVYPNEVEEIISQIKGVNEVAVVGVKSDQHGEQVKAFIVPSEPTLTKDVIIDFCRRQLTAYSVPKLIEFRDELPKTNVGKVLRRALRDEESAA